MEPVAGVARFVRSCATSADRMRSQLGLSWRGVCALLAGLVAIVATVTVLGGVSEDVTRNNGLATSDRAHLRLFTQHRPSVVLRAAQLVTDLGGIVVLVLIAVAAGLLLWHRRVPLAAAFAPAFALGVAATLAEIGKQVVDRARPGAGLALVADREPSFPSGHATDSAALYVTLALVLAVFVLRRPLVRAGVVACSCLLVGAIGVSRLVLGVHWPTDVLAGWALGATVALAVTIGATLATRAVPPARKPPEGRVRRVGFRLGQVLTAGRPPAHGRGSLSAA